MKRSDRTRLSLMIAVVALGSATARAQQPQFVKVIPPGKEQFVSDLLGDKAPLPGGCVFDGAALDRTVIAASYVCGGKKVALELHHPSDGAGAAATTTQFAIVPKGEVPPALLGALKDRIAQRESSWRWVSAEAPGLGSVAASPTANDTPQPGLTPEQSERFLAGVKLYRDRKYPEALDAFLALGHDNPHGGVLGMVVASLASTMPDADAVKKLAAKADANPGDTLAQFVAGVAAHYAGHQSARTRAEKTAMYEATIKYLSRARPAFEFEPRLFVYLAISNFRLGHQAEAQQLIEQAIPLSVNDPDVYYCRAEILQAVDAARAIADIEKYQSMIAKLHAQGVQVDPAKNARVERMLAELRAVAAGKKTLPPDDGLFDPLAPEPPKPGSGPGVAAAIATPPRSFASPSRFAGLAVGICLLAAVAWIAAGRLRRR